jgi:hypothetical protein
MDHVFDYFVGDTRFFKIPEDTGWDLTADLAVKSAKTALNYVRANPSIEFGMGSFYRMAYKDVITKLETELNQAYGWRALAKPSSEFPNTARALAPMPNLGASYEGVSGSWEKDGFGYTLDCWNNESGKASILRIRRLDLYSYLGKNASNSFQYRFPDAVTLLGPGQSFDGLTYEDALMMAQQVIRAITGEKMSVASAEGIVFPAETGIAGCYTFVFAHELGGVQCRIDAIGMAYDQNQYDEVWENESIQIIVDKDGIVYFGWYFPMKITEELSGGVPFLTFEEVMGCFSKMVFIKNSYLERDVSMDVRIVDGVPEIGSGEGDIKADNIFIRIEKITLGLMRVQSGREYLLIPVWDFYGHKKIFCADGSDFYERAQLDYMLEPLNFLTINAIDGSVIDRNYGY